MILLQALNELLDLLLRLLECTVGILLRIIAVVVELHGQFVDETARKARRNFSLTFHLKTLL